MSPGNTFGTNIADGFPAPAPVRFLIKHVALPYLAPLFGMAHSVEAGAKRIVQALTDPSLNSGVFYGSKADTRTVRLSTKVKYSRTCPNPTFQDNAYEAVHRFIAKSVLAIGGGQTLPDFKEASVEPASKYRTA